MVVPHHSVDLLRCVLNVADSLDIVKAAHLVVIVVIVVNLGLEVSGAVARRNFFEHLILLLRHDLVCLLHVADRDRSVGFTDGIFVFVPVFRTVDVTGLQLLHRRRLTTCGASHFYL